MEKRNYPTERKPGPLWECPVCKKNMSARGKTGHMEKVHNRGKLNVSDDPLLRLLPPFVQKRRPLARNDVRKLISNVFYILIEASRQPDILEIRRALTRCEYMIREVETNFNCTLEQAWEKFQIAKDELDVFKKN